jgi:hypothetical protein
MSQMVLTKQQKVSYTIANDGADGDLSGAGGDYPMFAFLMRLQSSLAVVTTEATTDAICIGWTGVT